MNIQGTTSWKFPETRRDLEAIKMMEISGEIKILDETPAGWHAPQGGVLVRVLKQSIPSKPKSGFFGFLNA